MSDAAHKATDKALEALEARVKRVYGRSNQELKRKLRNYLEDVQKGREKQEALLKAGKITQTEFKDWVTRKTAMGKRWEELAQDVADDLENSNKIARKMADGTRADVYALNHNFAIYQCEHDGRCSTVYQLYDRHTVERLMKEDRKLMPPPGKQVKEARARQMAAKWNNQNLQSALTQSILQGESIPEMAVRISHTVVTKNYSRSVMYARTMVTGAENAGRQDGYKEAEDMGIELEKEWIATLDDRTRHSHRMLHGEHVPVDEPYSNGCMFPGDPNGDPSEVYNCRCSQKARISGFDRARVESSPKMGDLSFEEWQEMKG